jgi:tetratricopeptide (TPR) repeat protein
MRSSFQKFLFSFCLIAVVFSCQAQKINYNAVFDSLFRNNLLDEALVLSEKLEKEESVNGPTLWLAFAINKKGHAWFRKGDWLQADSLFREAVNVATLAGQTEIIQFTDLLNSLGNHAGRMGHFDEALEVYNRILQIKTKLLGENDPAIIRTRSNISLTYLFMGFINKMAGKKMLSTFFCYGMRQERFPHWAGFQHPNNIIRKPCPSLATCMEKSTEITYACFIIIAIRSTKAAIIPNWNPPPHI